MTRSLIWGAAIALVAFALVGCTGESHTTDRPTVTDCDTATSSGLQADPCAFDVECGTVNGSQLRSAVCDNGVLLTSVIDERSSTEAGACTGELIASAGVNVTYAPSGRGCIDVDVCTSEGGTATVREAHLCQNGLAPTNDTGSPWADCAMAVQMGQDGEPCAGTFACIVDRSIGAAGVIPILGWCDGGVLRLAPSQTLLYGPPG